MASKPEIFNLAKKGQGATEYLVLLAVVLIVAMVAISLLGFFPGITTDAQIGQSKAYWSGTARPISIMETAQSNGAIAGSGDPNYRYLALTIRNIDAEPRTIDAITLQRGNYSFTYRYDNNVNILGGPQLPFTTFPGRPETLYLRMSTDLNCEPGRTYQYRMSFEYSTDQISGQRQIGQEPLIGMCS